MIYTIDINQLKKHNPLIPLTQYSDGGHASQEFVRKIKDVRYKLISRCCELCQGENFHSIGESNYGFKWSLCNDCGFVQLQKQLSHKSLNEFYQSGKYQSLCMGGLDDFTHFSLELNTMSLVFTRLFEILEPLPQSVRIIEIGCGSGGIIKKLQELGYIASGFDIDHHRISYGKKMGVKELKCADALCESTDIAACDYLILSNVLKHLYEPQKFLH